MRWKGQKFRVFIQSHASVQWEWTNSKWTLKSISKIIATLFEKMEKKNETRRNTMKTFFPYLWGFQPWKRDRWRSGRFCARQRGSCSWFRGWRPDWAATTRAAPVATARGTEEPSRGRRATSWIGCRSSPQSRQHPTKTWIKRKIEPGQQQHFTLDEIDKRTIVLPCKLSTCRRWPCGRH